MCGLPFPLLSSAVSPVQTIKALKCKGTLAQCVTVLYKVFRQFSAWWKPSLKCPKAEGHVSKSGFILQPGNISGNAVIFSYYWSETMPEKGSLLLPCVGVDCQDVDTGDQRVQSLLRVTGDFKSDP